MEKIIESPLVAVMDDFAELSVPAKHYDAAIATACDSASS